MSPINRREFLDQSAKWAALLAAAGTPSLVQAQDKETTAKGSAMDQLRVAVVGVRGRGMSHVEGFAGKHNCVVTTICDCDEGVIGKAMTVTEKQQKRAPKFVRDIRKVVEDKDIDIVAIATPNHWHALMAIWAMQNGKDVYVEKPVSHNVSEGRRMVEAARKYGKICQTGTQSRSMKGMRDAIEFVQSGKIGKVELAYGLCYKPRGSIGKVASPSEPPKGCDYDLWCGPAPKLPITRKNMHYDWHWIWAYGNGDLGNQGIHEMDKARWGLGVNSLPTNIISCGGRFGYEDDGETANTQLCLFDYGSTQIIFEVRGLATPNFRGAKVGNVFVGSEGYVVCPSYSSGIVYSKDGEKLMTFEGGGDHFGNFVKAVRSRKVADLNADILEGHLSSALCHLGNISYRLGQEIAINDIGNFGSGTAVQDALTRMKEHLKANKVDTATVKARVGVQLTLDPKTEMFQGAPAAAVAMLTREYRKGFEVPAQV